MEQSIESFGSEDNERIGKLREWAAGHFEDVTGYAPVSGKLRLIQTVLDNKWVSADDTLKLQSLGIAFGDALEQDVSELSWVMVDDEFGRDPALQWLATNHLVFPLTAIAKRIEDGMEVDVEHLFSGFKKAIRQSVASDA